jgi:hypothetical protein
MNLYQSELQGFRPFDQMQTFKQTDKTKGYYFISTAAHGYLVVPNDDSNFELARKIAGYGYIGKWAVYLEQDCEAWEFLDFIG